tara:strand:- start:14 stop:373 length:360 start_codon:yes stop_codon:yes gene_type:complete
MRNVNSLPNGRIVLACLDCGHKHDLAKFGWSKIVCSGCKRIIHNPVHENVEDETRKTNLMLSSMDRQYIGTIATIHGVSKSRALTQILEYSRQEYQASGGQLIEDSFKDDPKRKKRIKQ